MRLLLRRIVFFLGYMFHNNNRSKVIYYHDVSKKFTDMGTDFELMKKHFNIIIRNGYEIVPQIIQPKRQVMICFDDGWAGIYEYREEFVQRHIFPTIFIAVDLIDKDGYLTKKQIKELERIGFRFMAHTWSHEDLTTFSETGLDHELRESKECLEKEFGHPFDAICYPMGRFSKMVKEKSMECGYTQLYTSLPGGYFDMQKDNLICRNCAQNVSLNEFKWMLNGTSLLFRHKLMKQHFEKD